MKTIDVPNKGSMPPPLPAGVLYGYGVGHLFNDLCSALWFTYSLIFYNKVLEFTSFYAGLIMLIGQIADALATPAIGIWSDSYSLLCLSSLGKRKSWYTLGTIMVVISMPFMYSKPVTSSLSDDNVRLAYYGFFVVIFQFGWAAVQTVHLALVTELSIVSNERTRLISLRNTFTVVSNITVYVIAALALSTSSDSSALTPSDIWSFAIVAASLIFLGGLSSLAFCILVKERTHEPLLEQRSEENLSELVPVTVTTHCDWLKTGCLYHVALVYMFTRIYCNVVQSLIPLYIHKSLYLPTYSLAVVPLIMFISSFVASVFCGILTKYLGKKVVYALGGIFAIAACVWVELEVDYLFKTYFIYAVAVLLGIGNSFMVVVAIAVISDLIGCDTRNSAFIYGIMSFVDKLSCGIVIMLIQSFAPDTDPTYYTHALAFSCGLAAALGGLVTCFLPSSLVRTQVFTDNPPSNTNENGA